MPNWCYNTLKVKGADALAVKELVADGDRVFSLNKILPMPKELDYGDCPSPSFILTQAMAWARKHKKDVKVLMDAFRKYHGEYLEKDAELDKRAGVFYCAVAETGYPSWYEWRCEHWGTKWDATDCEILNEADGLVVFQFDTAWGPPLVALGHLSKLFPNTEFFLECTTEDDAHSSGMLKNGELFDFAYSEGESELE